MEINFFKEVLLIGKIQKKKMKLKIYFLRKTQKNKELVHLNPEKIREKKSIKKINLNTL